MGSVTRTKLMSIMALGAMIGLLLLPILVAIPALASDGGAPAAGVKKEGGDAKVEKGKDVYYKTEGIVSGPPAPCWAQARPIGAMAAGRKSRPVGERSTRTLGPPRTIRGRRSTVASGWRAAAHPQPHRARPLAFVSTR